MLACVARIMGENSGRRAEALMLALPMAHCASLTALPECQVYATPVLTKLCRAATFALGLQFLLLSASKGTMRASDTAGGEEQQ